MKRWSETAFLLCLFVFASTYLTLYPRLHSESGHFNSALFFACLFFTAPSLLAFYFEHLVSDLQLLENGYANFLSLAKSSTWFGAVYCYLVLGANMVAYLISPTEFQSTLIYALPAVLSFASIGIYVVLYLAALLFSVLKAED